MTIVFTEEEKKWIDKKPFNWKIKSKCPLKLRKEIKKKLDILNCKSYSYEKGFE